MTTAGDHLLSAGSRLKHAQVGRTHDISPEAVAGFLLHSSQNLQFVARFGARLNLAAAK